MPDSDLDAAACGFRVVKMLQEIQDALDGEVGRREARFVDGQTLNAAFACGIPERKLGRIRGPVNKADPTKEDINEAKERFVEELRNNADLR
jgi:hypothetical protein